MREFRLSVLLLAAILTGAAAAQATDSRAKPEALDWWREARFGLFVHWGPVSLKGTEISWSRGGERRGIGGTGEVPVGEYDNLYKRFNPTKFDAHKWVAMAKAAGMKYLVFTTRHHDGFSMFDTKQSDYKITSPESPFRRDVVAELARECHKAGLRLGFYYSPPDWHNPDYRSEHHDRFLSYFHGQVKELLSNYGKVDVLWFDGLGGTPEDWDSPALFKMIRSLQPGIIVNDRGGFEADYSTPEQTIGGFNRERPWESCITIGDQWSYRPNDRIKTLEECVRTLVRCAGGDGNLLLNVGPMPTGEVEPAQAECLREVGKWLKHFGRTIYGTRGGPYKPGAWGASTCKGRSLFLHVFAWQGEGLTLPALPAHVLRVKPLSPGKARVDQSGSALRVVVEPKDRQAIDTVIELGLDRDAEAIPPMEVPAR